MNLRLILGVSICLNGVLIAVSVSDGLRVPPAVARVRFPSALRTNEDTPEPLNRREPRAPVSRMMQQPLWSAIRSDDLHAYVSNLRVAGFPEPILQNIIVAELDRLFVARMPTVSLDTNFWRTGPERDVADMERRQAERMVDSERRAKIKELLGVEWYETPAATKGDSYWVVLFLGGAAAADKIDHLNSLWAKINDKSTELQSPSGLNTPELEARRRQAYEETIDELRRALGPAGFEELELRALAMDVTDVWGSERLFGNVMTGAELREFLRIKRDATLPLHDLFDLESPQPNRELTRDIDSRLRVLLGEERFNGYQRAKDPQFRWIRGSMDKNESMELTWAVYDIYAGLREASNRVRDQAGLSDEVRQTELRNLRTATENALAKAMGPEKFGAYVGKNHGNFSWLDDLTVKEDNSK